MTARWEWELEAISQRQGSYKGFIEPLLVSLHELIAQSQAVLPEGLKNIERKPVPGKKRRSGKAPRKATKKTGATRGRPPKKRPRASG